MNNILKYIKYASSYIRHGDFRSIIDSTNFILLNKGAKKNRIINSYLGKMKIRKGTNDFQFTNYFYEWGVKSYFIKNLPTFDTFFDIGAGIGDYSIFMASKGLKVFSFEPIDSNFNIFDENIKLNNLNAFIKAFKYAIGSQNAEAEFVVTPINTGASHRIDKKLINLNKKGIYKENVKVRTLDELYKNFDIDLNANILVKMDMEGMEIEGIEGAKDFLTHFTNITIAAEAKHSKEGELEKLLKSIANFEIGKIDEYNIYAKKLSNLN